VFKVECCIDFGDRIGGYAVPVATASGSVSAKPCAKDCAIGKMISALASMYA
jgi:hypothetical protein